MDNIALILLRDLGLRFEGQTFETLIHLKEITQKCMVRPGLETVPEDVEELARVQKKNN